MAFGKYCLSVLFLFSVLILGACGYSFESSHQDVTFLTPDAQDTKCYAYIDKRKYQVFPPQTINVKKSEEDMKITCNAPGNRKVEMFVPAMFLKKSLLGGPPGLVWDYASDSLYYYPSVIAIDFSQEDIKPNKLPRHNNSDIRQPETYDLEEFRASSPRLNSDKYKTSPPLVRRGEADYSDQFDADMQQQGDHGKPMGGKSDLQSVIQGLQSGEPASEPLHNGEQGGAEDSKPLSLYPGQ